MFGLDLMELVVYVQRGAKRASFSFLEIEKWRALAHISSYVMVYYIDYLIHKAMEQTALRRKKWVMIECDRF